MNEQVVVMPESRKRLCLCCVYLKVRVEVQEVVMNGYEHTQVTRVRTRVCVP